jgi:N-acetylmuramate 1-kinase
MVLGDRARARWESTRDSLIQQACSLPRAFTLRDYHGENLIWLPDRSGAARIGLLDFQDAVRGWAAWDLAMLTQDARRDVSPAAREAALSAYLDLTGGQRTVLDEELAIIGALNALRITGLFARLIHRDGKPRYRAFMARQQGHLARNLAHPALEDMSAFVGEVAPFILEASR